MAYEVVRFTKRWLDSLPPPEDATNPPIYADEVVRHLRLTNGRSRKRFSVAGNSHGRRKDIKIGHWGDPDLTVDELRNRARKAYAEFRDNGYVEVDRRRQDEARRRAVRIVPSHDHVQEEEPKGAFADVFYPDCTEPMPKPRCRPCDMRSRCSSG